MEFYARRWYALDLKTQEVFRFMQLENERWKLASTNDDREAWLADDLEHRARLSARDPLVKKIQVWIPVTSPMASGIHRGTKSD